MDFQKPIKRSKELVPLSKEHHEALLFCWKIKQGLRNGTELKLLAEFVQWFWEADLEEHFRKEEQVLAVHLPQGNELVVQLYEEHMEIEALVRLCAMVQDEELLLQLADGLHNHIRFEERKLFPYAEEQLTPEVKAAVCEGLETLKPHSAWTHEFWLRKK